MIHYKIYQFLRYTYIIHTGGEKSENLGGRGVNEWVGVCHAKVEKRWMERVHTNTV